MAELIENTELAQLAANPSLDRTLISFRTRLDIREIAIEQNSGIPHLSASQVQAFVTQAQNRLKGWK